MSNAPGLSRRQLLSTTVAAAGAVVVGAAATAPAQAAPPRPRNWARSTSQNGWPVVDGAKVASHRVEGSDARITLAVGAVSTVLLHVLRRFHYEVGAVGRGDLIGHRTTRTVVAAFESNYLSGTAVAIRPNFYPVGSAGNFFTGEMLVIRDILAECDGVVRWGGDDRDQPSEGHFQIDVPPGDARLDRLARTFEEWADQPDRGPGTMIDLLNARRRGAAKDLQARQRPF